MNRSLWMVIVSGLLMAACAGIGGPSDSQRQAELVKNGNLSLSVEDYITAEYLFKQALVINDQNPYALCSLGYVYQRTDRFEAARKTYRKLIALNPPDTAMAGDVQGYAGIKLVEIARINLNQLPPPETHPPAQQVQDGDSDGIADAQDRCPGTPPGAGVSQIGCWTLHDLFPSGTAEMEPYGRDQLNRVVLILQKNASLRLEIQGYTDNQGSAAFNQRLSAARARAVMRYLINQGIDPQRLRSTGYGFANPIASNDTEEGRRLNRRVELKPLP